jgi:hypothetical protein
LARTKSALKGLSQLVNLSAKFAHPDNLIHG